MIKRGLIITSTTKYLCALVFIAGAFLFLPGKSVAATELSLSDDGRSAGYVSLSWQENGTRHYVLQQRGELDWRTLYEGPDRATTLTGLSDGLYQFRVGDGNGAWSPQLSVEIKHHPLSRAWLFFAMGLALFAALLMLVFTPPRFPLEGAGSTQI